MNEAIVSRQSIARQAGIAAALWARDPNQPKPPNPYDAELEPNHFKQWHVDFERQAHCLLVPESEGGC